MTHDPKLCFCGMDDDCHCQCEKCQVYRVSKEAAKRREAIREKFAKSGMSMADLAEIVWIELEPLIEAKIETMAKACLQRNVEGMTLHSIVAGGWIK